MSHPETSPLIFSGTSHPQFAKEIAENLGLTMGKAEIGRFPDGEISLQILESVRARDVFVVQATAIQPNRYLMELFVLLRVLKMASARRITAIIPYFGYSRQDSSLLARKPISAKLVADMIELAGADRVLTMDLHVPQVQGFFNIPVDHLYGRPALIDVIKKEIDISPERLTVVATDMGGVKLARIFAEDLGVGYAIVDKERLSSRSVSAKEIVGEVKGQDVLIADDMCSTAQTLVTAIHLCKEKGARRIYVAITHGLFVDDALALLETSPVERVWVTNTVPSKATDCLSKIEYVSVAPIFAQGCRCILEGGSLSSLFKKQPETLQNSGFK